MAIFGDCQRDFNGERIPNLEAMAEMREIAEGLICQSGVDPLNHAFGLFIYAHCMHYTKLLCLEKTYADKYLGLR
jgi:hypothetical protein